MLILPDFSAPSVRIEQEEERPQMPEQIVSTPEQVTQSSFYKQHSVQVEKDLSVIDNLYPTLRRNGSQPSFKDDEQKELLVLAQRSINDRKHRNYARHLVGSG